MARPLGKIEIMSYALELSRYLKPKEVIKKVYEKFGDKLHRNTLLQWRKRKGLNIRKNKLAKYLPKEESDYNKLKKQSEQENKKLNELKEEVIKTENNAKYLRLRLIQMRRELDLK